MSSCACNYHVSPSKPQTEFRPRVKSSAGGKKGELNAICGACCDQRDASRKARKRKAADEAAPTSDGQASDGDGIRIAGVDLGDMSAGGFLDAIREMDAPITVRARLAAAMGKAQCLHWSREDRSIRRRTNKEVIAYSCAQSADREKKAKVPKGTRHRDSRRMPRFQCRGWLHVTVSAMSNVMEILLRHEEDHLA
ncbi:hypothetical protein BC628DRAFT_442238 [Trametes gibbosa]|nr:hypothetical protein BC628DRAFT_442238 [Trametes gibbosa]